MVEVLKISRSDNNITIYFSDYRQISISKQSPEEDNIRVDKWIKYYLNLVNCG